jgi:RNA polymerase sigma factor (sigma-70 family)
MAVDQVETSSAIEESIRVAGPRLKWVLARYRIPVEDAEDLLQQTFLALVDQWEEVREPERWLIGTLKRQCLMYWRRQRRRFYSAVDEAILDLLSSPEAPPQEKAALQADLDALLQRVPPRCREVLELRFRLGYDPSEVAEKLGYRASSIGKITHRCLAALSRALLTPPKPK